VYSIPHKVVKRVVLPPFLRLWAKLELRIQALHEGGGHAAKEVNAVVGGVRLLSVQGKE
jgi:hypothetical protein